ncbi:MAG: hypothetical protein Q8T03_14840 [Bacteroidota bacterium]|nr:hypothetical protein [Bacteroidota bacterium]
MKAFTLFTIALTYSLTVLSQDTMHTQEGSLIAGKVIEISENKIKYKKSTNLNGPLYVIDKSTITMIEYKNGTQEVFPKTKKVSDSNNSTELTIVKAKEHSCYNSFEEVLPGYYLRQQSRRTGWTWGWGYNFSYFFFH